MKILHLITNLEPGGAEIMLLNLLQEMPSHEWITRIVSMREIGIIGSHIQDLGIPVQALKMQPGIPNLKALIKLVRILKQDPPDLIQTWMYHADLLGSLAALLAGHIPTIWGLHHTFNGKQSVNQKTRAIVWLNAILSNWLPKRVVCCAESVREGHKQIGYDPKKLIVIPNGIDVQRFHPDPTAASKLKLELGIADNALLIGHFARFHIQKDHQSFIEAASLLLSEMSGVHFILAGEGITEDNRQLRTWINNAGVSNQIHLLGFRQDMPFLMAGIDVGTLSSAFGEALPLTIAETMACAIPCVVTDVGDSKMIVGVTGKTVPPKDPLALSKAWKSILSLSTQERDHLGQLARSRIKNEYNIQIVSKLYNSLYKSIII